MKILVTRHGETDWNKQGRFQGQSNVDINHNGKLQAIAIWPSIPETPYCIISSPLRRAMSTAKQISNYCLSPIITDDRLKERNLGDLEGHTLEEIKKMMIDYPEISDIWNYSKNVNILGIEPIKDFFDRVYSFLNETIHSFKNSKKPILVVTHVGVAIPINCYFSNYPLEQIKSRNQFKRLGNCEVVEYDV